MAGTGSQNLSSATSGVVVTPNDTNLVGPTRALYVGGTGDVAVRFVDGQTLTLPAVQGGTLLQVQVDRIMSSGTTATGIVAMW